MASLLLVQSNEEDGISSIQIGNSVYNQALTSVRATSGRYVTEELSRPRGDMFMNVRQSTHGMQFSFKFVNPHMDNRVLWKMLYEFCT